MFATQTAVYTLYDKSLHTYKKNHQHETWLSEKNFSKKKWCAVGSSNSIINCEISPRIAMLNDLEAERSEYFSLYHANKNTQIMLIFQNRLADC